MIPKSQLQTKIDQIDQKIPKMEEALADCQGKYDQNQTQYAKLVTLHLGKAKEPQSLRSQERSLDTLRNKIEALQQSIYLHQSQKDDLQKQLNLADIYETHAKPFLDAEQKFQAVGEALSSGLGDLRQKIASFNKLVEQFFPIANAPIERLQALVTDTSLEGISLEKFIRRGNIQENGDHHEFLHSFGTMYQETADILPTLDEDTLSGLEKSCQALSDWIGFVRRANWPDVVRRGTTYTPSVRQRSRAVVGQKQMVTRMPLAPPVDNDHQQRLEEIARHRKLMTVRTVNANVVSRSGDD